MDGLLVVACEAADPTVLGHNAVRPIQGVGAELAALDEGDPERGVGS